MKKLILLLFIPLVFSCSDDEDNTNPVDDTNPVYLDENGVTVKAKNWAEVGMTGEINGVTYTIVDRPMLEEMFANDENVSAVCTSLISEMNDLIQNISYTNPDFNQDISSWDVSNVTTMKRLFRGTQFNQDISAWDVSNVVDMSYMFDNSRFNQDISAWDVSNVVNMEWMFANAHDFNQDISSWDVSNVVDMWGVFLNSSFNQDISSWDVESVTNMQAMFGQAYNFNQDLSVWQVNNVTNCNYFSCETPSWSLPKPEFSNCGDTGCN